MREVCVRREEPSGESVISLRFASAISAQLNINIVAVGLHMMAKSEEGRDP
jgi:hypothetical protein